MLVTANIEQKSIGNTLLFKNLRLHISDQEKLAVIGRNGVGKTTLFRMLAREDGDYSGHITYRPGARVVVTRQEHHEAGTDTTLQYILSHLPEYTSLLEIIENYPSHMGDNLRKIARYSEALERFAALDYYTIEDRVRRSLDTYQLGTAADRPFAGLSGGQKRFVELIRVEHSAADLALIDEPTNHMDTVAKAAFLEWFAAAKHAVVVITHDRDLLQKMERIIEIKDHQAITFPGNYDAYLLQNTNRTTASLNEYEVVQRRIIKVKKQIRYAQSRKSSWSGTADERNPFVVMEERLRKELKELESKERPSFWIDRESVADLRPKLEESYQKHKAKTIRIRHLTHAERTRELLHLEEVQVGYDTRPLFAPLTLSVQTGERTRIAGRNGVGKTTLVRTILDSLSEHRPATLLGGTIKADHQLRIRTYEQEIDPALLDLTLTQAITRIHDELDLPITGERIMQLLSDYLFDPYSDREHLVAQLSGGQKARLQLIRLFAGDPNLLILDEPTNHLDLPSIEELEEALRQYHGALLYISHDSYLSRHLGGKELNITPLSSPK